MNVWLNLYFSAASWFISPVLSGLVSCGLFILIDYMVLKKVTTLSGIVSLRLCFESTIFQISLEDSFVDPVS